MDRLIEPISGPFLAIIILGEKIVLTTVIGAVFLLSGMFCAIYGHMKWRRRNESLADAGAAQISRTI